MYMLIAYDGTDFHGWQDQVGVRTVQAELEEALRRVVRHPVSLIGSGRTDAGVHAAGHVNSFVTTCPIPDERFRHAIGSRLPQDLSIIALREAAPEFDARRDAISKLYRYRIYNTRRRPVQRIGQSRHAEIVGHQRAGTRKALVILLDGRGVILGHIERRHSLWVEASAVQGRALAAERREGPARREHAPATPRVAEGAVRHKRRGAGPEGRRARPRHIPR